MINFKQYIPTEPIVLANVMITPDGTILQSYYKNDYKTHTDKNGFTYVLDSGLDLFVWTKNDGQANHFIIDSNDDHSVIREWFSWGSYGVNGDHPVQWIKLKDMTDDHISAILGGGFAHVYHFVFENEVEWRESH